MSLTFSVPGNLGNVAGPASDGVLIGQLTAVAPSKALLKTLTVAGICITDDGGTYVDETTPFGEATADDVEILPATPAAEDAWYVGHATKQFEAIHVNVTTAAADLVATLVWEYWDGDSWATLSVTDPSSDWSDGTGWYALTFSAPSDWDITNVDNQSGYFIRQRVSAYTSITTAPQLGQGYVQAVDADATWTDDTTDFGDAGTADCQLLPTYPVVGSGFYIGYTEKFCKVSMTLSTALSATLTGAWQYWNGSSWAAISTKDDDSTGLTAGTSTYLLHFVPPSDWAANTAANGPNSSTGYFIRFQVTAFTSVTAAPVLSVGTVYPLKTGASGVNVRTACSTLDITANAQTKSGTTADSVFLFLNTTTGEFLSFTWTKADPNVSASGTLLMSVSDDLALVQITEDGSTEFANANFTVNMVA